MNNLILGDSLEELDKLEENSVDSIVTDPPYELNFMGKGWDNAGISFNTEIWQKCLRVLKPGGHLLAFGGSRTFHRIACAIEDSGFEIRDTIMWLYGSGFPKSMDISKQIDKKPNKTYEAKIRFGELIKEYRNKSNLTQRQLGELIGVSRELINLYEIKGNNQQQIPTKEQWKKIKKILNIYDDMDYIYEEAEREVIGKKESGCFNSQEKNRYTIGSSKSLEVNITIPSTDLAKQWQGWGTALKPAFEPIIVARKPFKGSLVDNVIKWGVGGLNIDECRVEFSENEPDSRVGKKDIQKGASKNPFATGISDYDNTTYKANGRFPANLILTYEQMTFDEVCGGFPDTKSVASKANYEKTNQDNITHLYTNIKSGVHFNDSGSASRYFYCAKASKKDRDEGLEEFDDKYMAFSNQAKAELKRGNIEFKGNEDNPMNFVNSVSVRKNIHPTVKPTDLMQYLVRLVTPNNGVVLDPFMGSGSTGKACMYENLERNKNYSFIGIEKEPEYFEIAKARIKYVERKLNK